MGLPTHIPDVTTVEGIQRDIFWITSMNVGFRTALVLPLLKNSAVGATGEKGAILFEEYVNGIHQAVLREFKVRCNPTIDDGRMKSQSVKPS